MEYENRWYVRAWIRFWYNEATRMLVVLFGTHVLLWLLICYWLFGPGEYLRNVAMFSYILVFGWAMLDNNFENLKRLVKPKA